MFGAIIKSGELKLAKKSWKWKTRAVGLSV